MLTLFEDAIRDIGRIPPDTTGTYWRAVYRHGLTDSEFKNIIKFIWGQLLDWDKPTIISFIFLSLGLS
jgi:hypothetical protein